MSDTTLRPIRTDHDDNRALGEIVASLGHDVGELVQAQVDLAKAELRDTARQAGQAGVSGGAALLMVIAALVLLGAAAAWGIAEVWPAWAGFLIVGGIYTVVAIALALLARQRLEAVTEGPTETIETLQEDAQWVRQHRN